MTIVTVLFDLLVAAHIATGFIGVAAFWVPVFARKGGRWHVRSGRVYEYCAYVVTLSSITAAAGRIASYQVQGIGFADEPELYGFSLFLAYLGVVTFATVRQAIRAVQTRKAPETLRTRWHEAVGWMPVACSAGIVVLAVAMWSDVSPLLLAASPIGMLVGWNSLRTVYHPRGQHMGWFYSHMTSILAGGVAFHSACIVQQTLAYELSGALAVLPWILPSIVGLPAIVLWTRYYQRRFAPAGTA